MNSLTEAARKYYLGFNAPLHILCVVCLFFIPLDLVQVLGFYILFYLFGIQIGFHRLIAHRSFTPRYEWIKYVLAIIGTGGLIGGPIVWAQYHRWHHMHSDTEKDPQNIHKGRLYSHYGWLLNPIPVPLVMVKDMLRDKGMMFIDKYNRWFPITFLLIALAVSPITFMACLTAMIITFQVDMSINSIVGHSPTVGLKNNAWLSIPTAGTSLHKNHHLKSGNYDFGYSVSNKWYEIDPCRYIVPILSK